MKSFKNILLVILVVVLLSGFYKIYTWFVGPESRILLNQASVVKEIKSLNRLETASFTLEKIIEGGVQGNAFQNILYGDKILLIAHAEVIAGFDLTKLKAGDVKVSDTSLEIDMPSPEILVSRLDNEKTRVYDRKLGIFTKGDPQLESEARLAAEISIQQAACDAGILMVARANAEKQLTAMFTMAGFEKVVLNVEEGECK